MNRLQDEQTRRNEISRDCWQLYAPHRRIVTDLLLGDKASDHRRLCVLGAGNCNDLDLQRLAASFQEIHLVDLDPLAMNQAVASQGPFDDGQPVLHADVDLTGLIQWLSQWTPEAPPDSAAVDEVTARLAERFQFALDQPVDVAVSVCLLSQIIDSIALSIGAEHPRFLPLVVAVRAEHLRMAASLLRPGGQLVLITDFNSSASCPELASIADDQLPEFTARLINDRNFFTGLNPFVLHALFDTDPWLSAHMEQAHLSKPWRWTFPTRTYVVCAIRAVKRVD